MNASIRSSFRLSVSLLVAFIVCSALEAQTAKARRNPTSKIFVADLEGQSNINTGERIEEISKKGVYDAQGTVIQTEKNSTNSLVFSNGLGIFLDPESRIEVVKFVQEPFTPNRVDPEVEPSISQTIWRISRGSISFCPAKPVAGSSMVYRTAHASVSLRGAKVFIEANDKQTKVSLVSGDVTVKGGEMDMGGQTLRPGQQAIISPGGGDRQMDLIVQDIPPADLPTIDQKVSLACMAKSTVYFDTNSRKDENDPAYGEIVAVPIVPAKLPVQHTVSASRVQGETAPAK